jgi:hypothetical protein
MHYTGPVQLLTTAGTPVGNAHGELWVADDPEPAVRWGSHLFPADQVRRNLADLDARHCEILVQLPSEQVGRASITEASHGWHRLLIAGLGPPPFSATTGERSAAGNHPIAGS